MSQFEHGADLHRMKEKYGICDVLDFSSNVNIFYLDRINEILSTIKASDLSTYPDIEYNNLREKISKKYSLDKTNIIVGNGSTELIFLVTKLDFIKNVGIVVPTFAEYIKELVKLIKRM